MENLIQKSSESTSFIQDLLLAKGYTESDGYLVKDDENHPIKHKFFIGEIQELGTYLEYYQNRRLVVTGYWHDEKDFKTEFENLHP